MTLSTIKKAADRHGLMDSREVELTEGRTGLMISLEYINESGKCRYIHDDLHGGMVKWCKRYNLTWEYRGYFTALLVYA